jgi:hypothetical protein
MTKPFDTQRFFDLGVAHIRKQGKPAFSSGNCLYATSDGLHCIAYPGLVDLGIEPADLTEDRSAILNLEDAGIKLTEEEALFANDFQASHDMWAYMVPNHSMSELEVKLMAIAERYSLTYTPPV